MFNKLDVIANALGWEIIKYNGWYELDQQDGSRGFYCENLNDVTSNLVKIINEYNRKQWVSERV